MCKKRGGGFKYQFERKERKIKERKRDEVKGENEKANQTTLIY
jgi:hypothetical protein